MWALGIGMGCANRPVAALRTGDVTALSTPGAAVLVTALAGGPRWAGGNRRLHVLRADDPAGPG